ncbi:MAG: NACHT domain-containing protein [Symplocastrum torsivum CPER-KK1]|jgi:energy-coupling factor transporter ATP-binding protein EcfA2|uniref:NACHT domain-containing protein n=1 Tax=Symplocastrum torsivum CPER-KK1 TaxID=450513 RepID=A0A951PNW2_9CYAN|nr:NACHT domain-containing protein [Symplocastrum torsivum CPER-KK1]
MSGSGGGSGYNFQARAIAYVGAHILAQRRLDWIDHSIPDIPVAVATETGGPGDDIQVTLQDGVKLEIQAKKGLRYDQKFWDALLRLASGLTKEPFLHGVLLIDPKATGKIKNELREDFRTLGVNGSGNLKQLTQEVIARFHQEGIQVNSELFRRFKIIQADFQDSSPEVKFASELLSKVVHDGNQAKNAWKVLDSDGHELIELTGKRDAVALARLLTNVPIELSETADNPIIVAELYREWLNRITAYFTVLGFGTELSVESAWIHLQASNHKNNDQAFNADYIPHAYHRVVVTGKSGAGKSTFLQRVAHRLSNSDKRVLWIRLPRVAKYFEQGKPFAEAILIDAAENSGVEISQLKRVLANPDYLLADGLDECDVSQLGSIAQQLVSWSSGHSDTKIIATTRPDNHNAASFPEWEHVTLLPLASQDIKKNTRQLLEARFNDASQIENQLASFEQRLKVNRTASLAAQNPLLLGFLIQLSTNDVELSQHRSGLYESIIELSHKQSPLNRKFNVELEPHIAFCVIEITGWILQNSPEISERKLVEKLGKELADELDCKLLTAQGEAQKGLDFWKERRIVECLQMGHQNVFTFVHLSLQEYAAGKYAASLILQKLHEWLTQVRQEPKWKEVILFAAGAGAAEQIVTHLLSLDDSGESTSIELILAAEALAEVSKPSLELLKEVVKRLQLRLASSLPDVVFEAAEALSLLVFQAPNIIGTIAQSLFNHTPLWTRLSAMKLAIDCGESYVNLEVLTDLLDDIIAEPAQASGIFYKPRKRTYRNWNFQNQIACQGFQILLKNKPDLSVANQIYNFISKGRLSGNTQQVLTKLLSDILPEKLENKDSQESKGWSLICLKLIRPVLAENKPNPKKLLEDLRQREKAKLADQVFLEAIVHVANSNSEDLPSEEQSRELIALGILYSGMGWREIATTDWDVLSERQDLDAVEAVLKGMIAALDINIREITIDALWILSKIKSFASYDLDAIEVELNKQDTEDTSQGYEWALEQLLEIRINDKYRYIGHHIPKVFVNPKWESSKKIRLDTEKLIRALEHPSEGIRCSAALLLLNGAGGDEAADLVQKLLEDG